MSRKRIEQQVDVTTEARIVHAPESQTEIATKRGARQRGIGLQCACGTKMRVERTRRPGVAYPHWMQNPYRVWGCPKCGKKVRQKL